LAVEYHEFIQLDKIWSLLLVVHEKSCNFLNRFVRLNFTELEVFFLTMEVLLFVEQVRSKGFGKRGDDFPQKLL